MRGVARSFAFYMHKSRDERGFNQGGFAYMNAMKRTFGNQIDLELRVSARLPLI